MREVFICDAVRTAIGRYGGALAKVCVCPADIFTALGRVFFVKYVVDLNHA